MTTEDKIKIFQLMCSDAYQLGVVLFQQNELDFNEFVDYALHKAMWVDEISKNDSYFRCRTFILGRVHTVCYWCGMRNLSYYGFGNEYIKDRYRGWKLSTILQINPNFDYPPELDNEIYEDYMADKIYNEFKTNLKIEFDKLI